VACSSCLDSDGCLDVWLLLPCSYRSSTKISIGVTQFDTKKVHVRARAVREPPLQWLDFTTDHVQLRNSYKYKNAQKTLVGSRFGFLGLCFCAKEGAIKGQVLGVVVACDTLRRDETLPCDSTIRR